MKPERWKQIDDLFQAALDLDPEKRSSFLEKACSGDEALRKEVETLLDSDRDAQSFIESPALQQLAADKYSTTIKRAKWLQSSRSARLTPGESIGPYKVLSLIGAGGMGEVYRASDPRIGREVAIKILPSHFSQDSDRMRRFEQEARATGLINHPNILVIYDTGTEKGSPYLVSELLQGELLRQKLKGNPLSIRKTVEYSLQILRGLSAAHEKGIVHRDLKPENIFITKEGLIKILDFGVAKLTYPEISGDKNSEAGAKNHQTETGVVVGTVVYMSPEQARGLKVDHRSDIFAFGSVLYEMLSGKRPFDGESQIEIMHAILKSDPLELSQSNRNIPPSLERIVRRCLEKAPDHRFQTTSDLAFALEGVASTTAQIVSHQTPSRNLGRIALMTAAVLILLTVTFSVYWNRNLKTESSIRRSEPFRRMKISALTTTGKIFDAAISPDGKYFAYAIKDGDMQSLRVRQVATTSNVPILAPAAVRFQGITFSRDGNFIYYVVSPLDNPGGTVYRIPVLGGEPIKLIDDVYGSVAVSPDNSSLAFVGRSGLMISLADGNKIRTLAVPSQGTSFEGTPAWAPDGKTIVVIADDLAGYGNNLIAISVESKKQTPIASAKWFDIDQLSWLSDGSGFVLVAKENAGGYRNYQIWFLSYPKGEVSRITNDLNEYRSLSLTSDSSTIISVRLEQSSNIWVIDGQNSQPQQITHGAASLDGLWGISWTNDGKMIYTSIASGEEDLWLMTADGKNAKQLTTGQIAKIAPSSCPDGRYTVFMSRGSEGTHIWRIGMDGSGLKQLTDGASEGIPQCIDGRSVIYVSPGAGQWSLWKTSIDGGEAVQLTDRPSLSPVVSPDGKLIAYTFLDEKHDKNIGIISTEGGTPVKTLPLSSTVLVDIGLGLRWTSDARALTYIDVVDGVSNIWIQPLNGSSPKQRTNFKSGEIFSYDVSRNGKIAMARGSSARDVVLISDFAAQSRTN